MKPGRNDPCPCGSGKKYKKCCEAKSEFAPPAPKPPAKGTAPTPAECNQLVALFNSGDYAELENRTRVLLERCPDSGFTWKTLGASLQMQGKDSLPALQKATELLPNDAESHYNLGNTLKECGRLEEAAASYRQALQINPDFVMAHGNLGITLKELGRLEEAEASYRQALRINPDFSLAHSNLAHLLFEQGDSRKSISHYRKALSISPYLVNAHQGMTKALIRIVPGWHVPMMNEQKRNNAYYSAMQLAVTPDSEVFEIGTGSGLLAMMAAKLGAKSVTTCEAEPVIADTAQQIVADNGYAEAIKVISKRSVEVNVGEDLPEKADILVSEIFSSELLAEQVLPSIEDAKRRLLKPQGRIIPAAGSIMVALFSGDDIRRNLIVEDSFGFNLQRFNSIVSKKLMVYRHDLNIETLTEDTEAFRFDFENDSLFPSHTKNLRIPIKSAGRCYGIIQWIRLQMDKETIFENHPSEKSPVSNWQHCAYVFPEPIDVKPGQVALISASHDRESPWFFLYGIEPA